MHTHTKINAIHTSNLYKYLQPPHSCFFLMVLMGGGNASLPFMKTGYIGRGFILSIY